MGKSKKAVKPKPKPKELNSFEKLVQDKNTQKAKKLQKSRDIVEPQVKANLGNKFKVKKTNNEPNAQTVKKSLFELDSDDQEQNDLKNWRITHNGREIKDEDDYKEHMSCSSSDEQVAADVVKNYHFDGFTKQKPTKTRADVYKEIIVNSKQRKLEKMRLKEDNITKVQELNNVFPLIAEHLPKLQNKRRTVDDDYTTLAQLFAKEEKVVAQTIQANEFDEKRRERQRERKRQQIAEAEESSDVSEEANDDAMPMKITTEREKRMMKPLKKLQTMQKMMDNIRQAQAGRKEAEHDELDELSESDEEQGDEDSNDERSDQSVEGDSSEEGVDEDEDLDEGDEEGNDEEGEVEDGDDEDGNDEDFDNDDVNPENAN